MMGPAEDQNRHRQGQWALRLVEPRRATQHADFGAAWMPRDDMDSEELRRRIGASPPANSVREALAHGAKGGGVWYRYSRTARV